VFSRVELSRAIYACAFVRARGRQILADIFGYFRVGGVRFQRPVGQDDLPEDWPYTQSGSEEFARFDSCTKNL